MVVIKSFCITGWILHYPIHDSTYTEDIFHRLHYHIWIVFIELITAVSANNETVTFFVPRYPKIDILNFDFISHSFGTHIRLEHVSSNPQNTPAFIPIMLQHFGTQEDEI